MIQVIGRVFAILEELSLDGEVSLEMASGVTVPVGSITTVVPTGLATAPSPVKNGAELTITGKDLDLVTGVDLPNAAGVEFTNEGQIVLTVPEAAQAGDAVLHLENGKTVTVAYTLVEPTVTAFSENPASAGSAITVNGTDLDLVQSVTFGGGITVDVETGADAFSVAVPTAAETGVFVLNLKNGTSVETIELAIDVHRRYRESGTPDRRAGGRHERDLHPEWQHPVPVHSGGGPSRQPDHPGFRQRFRDLHPEYRSG